NIGKSLVCGWIVITLAVIFVDAHRLHLLLILLINSHSYPSARSFNPFAQGGVLPICSQTAVTDILRSASMIISSCTWATMEQFFKVCMALQRISRAVPWTIFSTN